MTDQRSERIREMAGELGLEFEYDSSEPSILSPNGTHIFFLPTGESAKEVENILLSLKPGVRVKIELGCHDCCLDELYCPNSELIDLSEGEGSHIPGPGCQGRAPKGYHYEMKLVRD